MSSDSWQIEVFYDGQCPLCTREIDLLRRLDRRKRIRFTDITAEGFDEAAYGRTQRQFMDRIQARLHSGQWIEGVEVFRQLYAAVGFGWLVALSRPALGLHYPSDVLAGAAVGGLIATGNLVLWTIL